MKAIISIFVLALSLYVAPLKAQDVDTTQTAQLITLPLNSYNYKTIDVGVLGHIEDQSEISFSRQENISFRFKIKGYIDNNTHEFIHSAIQKSLNIHPDAINVGVNEGHADVTIDSKKATPPGYIVLGKLIKIKR